MLEYSQALRFRKKLTTKSLVLNESNQILQCTNKNRFFINLIRNKKYFF